MTGLDWKRDGRLLCDVSVYTPEGTQVVGSGRVELSDVRRRFDLALDISKRNGSDVAVWNDALLSIYVAVDHQRKIATTDEFAPVEVYGIQEPPPLKFTVEKLLPRRMTTTFYGDSGQGKSTAANCLATCVATGHPFLGLETIKGPVVLLDWELDMDVTLGRLYRIARGMGLDQPPKGIFYQSLSAVFMSITHDLAGWVSEHNPELIVIDSFGPASGGDSMDHVLATQLMNSLRSIPATKLLVDHQSSPVMGVAYSAKREFGSSWKRHLTRSSLQLEQVAGADGKSSHVLRQQKSNFAPTVADIPFHIRYDGPALYLSEADLAEPEFQGSDNRPAWQRVETFLGEFGKSTNKELAEQLEISPKTVANAVAKLRGLNRIPKHPEKNTKDEPVYELAQ